MTDPIDLGGVRVLVVEDDFMLAQALTSTIQGAGGTVVGPVPSIQEALEILEALDALDALDDLDLGLLDIMLQDGVSTPVAERLLARGRPVLFLTGFHALDMLPERLHSIPCLEKPVERTDLLAALQQITGGGE